MRRKHRTTNRFSPRPRSRRHLAGPERVEPRYLMDGALPQLVADDFTVHANDDPQILSVLSNDNWNNDAGAHRITAVSFPTAGGTAEISSDGTSVLFRPSAGFSGDDSFRYVVDGQFSAQVTVHVISPLADDVVTVFPDGQPSTIGLLSNDPFWTGYMGDRRITALSATLLGGTVEMAADGRSVIYTAPDDPAMRGRTDHFNYIVDGKYAADVAVSLFDPLSPSKVSLPQNSDPVQLVSLDQSNFSQWPGYDGPQRITKVMSSVAGDSLTVGADGRTIMYRPWADFVGTDTITYVVDGKFVSTVQVNVGSATQSDDFQVDENDPGLELNPLWNDEYYDSVTGSWFVLARQITEVTQPSGGGRVEIVQGGSLVRYMPPADFVGSETFTYRANGKYLGTITVHVARPGRDDYLGDRNAPIVADSRDNVLDVLANDFARPGAHAITSVGTPAHGVVTIASNGQRLLYTPAPGYLGQEQFTYTVDGQYTATVHFRVQSPADDRYLSLVASQNHDYRIDLAPSLRGIGAYAGAGQVTAVSIVSGNATAVIAADGQGILVTDGDYSDTTISYTLDGKYTARIVIQFYDSRFLRSSNTVIQENQSGQVDVLANAPWQYFGFSDTVTYSGSRRLTGASGAQHGTISVAADGRTLVYQPAADYVGQDTFRYVVDGQLLGTATVQVVRLVRDDQYRVEADSQANLLSVELNDQLGAGYRGVGRITHVDGVSHGTITIAADGASLVYTPNPGYTGTDSAIYVVDGHLKATVQITVGASAQSGYPKFAGLAQLEDWLLQNALRQYGSLFGQATYNGGNVTLNFDGAFNAPTLPLASASHSDTNVQVAGVDEADLTEADANYLYVLSGGKLVISSARGETPLAIMSQTALDGSPIGMYLNGDRLTIVSRSGYPQLQPLTTANWLPWNGAGNQTTVTVLDVADRAHPRLVQKTIVDGAQVDSRQIGNFLYLVLGNGSLMLPSPQHMDDSAGLPVREGVFEDDGFFGGDRPYFTGSAYSYSGRYETQDEYVARVRAHFGEILDSILPHFRSYDADGTLVRGGLLLMPEEIGMPHDASRQSLLSIVTIDTASDQPGMVAATGVLSVGNNLVYMNHASLYLLGQTAWGSENQATTIIKFSFDPLTGELAPVAQGTAPGLALDQFSIEEAHGDLRIATTVFNANNDNWSGRAENDLWVLRQDGDLLELVGGLQNLAHGESIRSVRYEGDRAVITTFPTVNAGFDPVYMIDLANGTQPRFVGELVLPGYNQYMQFIDATHVLTVGVNAPTSVTSAWAGMGLPMQISLFDISDFAHPRLIDQFSLPRFSSSLAQQDHHAFGWFAELGILAVPVARTYVQQQDRDGDGYRESSVTVTADEIEYFRIQTSEAAATGDGVQFAGSTTLSTQALRGAFIGNTLYAIGDGQIVASSADDPDTPLDSVTWETPWAGHLPYFPMVQLSPIVFSPIVIQSTTSPTQGDSAILVSPFVPPPTEGPLGEWIQAARKDVAARLGVDAASALVVSMELPHAALDGDRLETVHLSGLKIVLRLGDQMLLYQVTDAGDVELVDPDFRFGGPTAVAADSSPTLDVDQDGSVTAQDALRIINDLLRHASSHRNEGASLRQLSDAPSSFPLDVNHDGIVSPQDLLLLFNALRQQTPMTSAAALIGTNGMARNDRMTNTDAMASAANGTGAASHITPMADRTGIDSAVVSQLVAFTGLGQAAAVDIKDEPNSDASTPASPAPHGEPLLTVLQTAVTSESRMATRLRQTSHDLALAVTDDWTPFQLGTSMGDA